MDLGLSGSNLAETTCDEKGRGRKETGASIPKIQAGAASAHRKTGGGGGEKSVSVFFTITRSYIDT